MTKQVQLSHESDRLKLAESQHRTLDARIQELARRAYLTPAEQLEVADLKKQKLKLKDEIHALRTSSS